MGEDKSWTGKTSSTGETGVDLMQREEGCTFHLPLTMTNNHWSSLGQRGWTNPERGRTEGESRIAAFRNRDKRRATSEQLWKLSIDKDNEVSLPIATQSTLDITRHTPARTEKVFPSLSSKFLS